MAPEWGPSHPEHWGNNRADDPNRSEGGAVGLMTQTALRGNNRAGDPDCFGGGGVAIGLMTLIALRGKTGLMTQIVLGNLPLNCLSRAPPAGVQPRPIQGAGTASARIRIQ